MKLFLYLGHLGEYHGYRNFRLPPRRRDPRWYQEESGAGADPTPGFQNGDSSARKRLQIFFEDAKKKTLLMFNCSSLGGFIQAVAVIFFFCLASKTVKNIVIFAPIFSVPFGSIFQRLGTGKSHVCFIGKFHHHLVRS